jgi:hypothetical protein
VVKKEKNVTVMQFYLYHIKWAEYITSTFDIIYSIFDIYPPPEDSLLQSFIFKLIDHSVGSDGADT